VHHRLEAQAVHQHDHFVDELFQIGSRLQLSPFGSGRNDAVEQCPKALELVILDLDKRGTAERLTPEGHFDAGFKEALFIERKRLQHDRAQGEQSRLTVDGLDHPAAEAAVRPPQRRHHDVLFVGEVVGQHAVGQAGLLGDLTSRRVHHALAGDHAIHGVEYLVPASIPIDDLGHPGSCPPC
jgi:hypothetical protein